MGFYNIHEVNTMAENKKSKDNMVFMFLIIGAAIALFFMFRGGSTTTGDDDKAFLTVTMYDAAGNPIKSSNGPTMSVVNGVSGVASIGVTATLRNTGAYALSCTLKNAVVTPSGSTLFNANMDKSTKSVAAGATGTWSTTANIPVVSFEGAGQQTFSLTAECTFNPGSGPQTQTKTGSFTLTVTAEGAAAFTFDLSSTGVQTEWCGDTICQASESQATCPTDCGTAGTTNVKFRTTANSYVSGTAIGVGTTCGNTLTKYGYYFNYLYTSDTCLSSCNSECTGAALMYSIPGSITATGFTGTGNVNLYSCGADASRKCICQASATGNAQVVIYKTSDPDAALVSDLPASTSNPALEVTCT